MGNHFKLNNVEHNIDICKIVLFHDLRNNLSTFINTNIDIPIEEYYNIDMQHNILLYYKNKCYYMNYKNIDVNFDNITDLILIITRGNNRMDIDDFKETLLLMNALPNTLINLTIVGNCFNEHCSYIPYYIENLNNLPPSLKSIKIIGIDEECVKNIKIPFRCDFQYKNDYEKYAYEYDYEKN